MELIPLGPSGVALNRDCPGPAHEPRLMVRTCIAASAPDGLETMRPPGEISIPQRRPERLLQS